jgi:general stress protein YciG
MEHEHNNNNADKKSRRGFASMDRGKQREIASRGGRAAHQKGTAHEFSPEEAAEAGRKGGRARSLAQGRGEEEVQNEQEPDGLLM